MKVCQYQRQQLGSKYTKEPLCLSLSVCLNLRLLLLFLLAKDSDQCTCLKHECCKTKGLRKLGTYSRSKNASSLGEGEEILSELPEVWCAYPCHWVPSRLIIECVCVCVRVTDRKTEGQKDRQTATDTDNKQSTHTYRHTELRTRPAPKSPGDRNQDYGLQ